MIPLNTPVCQGQPTISKRNGTPTPGSDIAAADWQQLLAQAIRRPQDLLAALGLEVGQLDPVRLEQLTRLSGFPLRVPLGYVARMRRGDPRDPLLLQVLPREPELDEVAGYVPDPVGDTAATVHSGVLHKYHGRALLITTAACPVHCRYCFRRHFDYADNQLDRQALDQAMDYLRDHPEIVEIILSGGDPLTLSNARLMEISDRLATLPYLRRLRIHSRMPIVLPERIDAGLLTWLHNLPWQTIVVTHSNHANEIDATVHQALVKLKTSNVTLLNQSVLLREVNDHPDDLVELSEALFAAGVLPYYLHVLDRVKGAHHFEVSPDQAYGLYQTLQQRLPGFLVPKLVREIAGHAHKVNIVPNNASGVS